MPSLCTLPLHGKKDALRARHYARQFAHLLKFSTQEEACIAAGAFLIAHQVLQRKIKGRMVFRIENHFLQVFAQGASPETGEMKDLDGIVRLSKCVPNQGNIEELDLGWLVRRMQTSAWLYDEITKQNQEVLSLLHELQVSQTRLGEGRNPHAA